MKKTSTRNILTKIFKKNRLTKVKKKVITKTKSKKIKNKNIKKKVLVKKVKLPKKNSLKDKKKKEKIILKKDDKINQKNDGLRISKSNEIKPEIKKVKKQETEKREYKIKDFVVYPKHGVGQITEFKKINIGGIDVETYVLKFEKDKAN